MTNLGKITGPEQTLVPQGSPPAFGTLPDEVIAEERVVYVPVVPDKPRSPVKPFAPAGAAAPVTASETPSK